MQPSTLNRLLFLLSGPTRPKELPAHDGPTITARSLRRLGPTIADAFVLFLHERLPLGTWLSDGLLKMEAATAKSAEMSLTYLDDAARLEKQKVIKSLVWQTVDRVCTPSRSAEPWEAFRPEFVEATAQWRRSGTSLPEEVAGTQDEAALSPSSSSSASPSSSSNDSSAVSHAPQLTAQFAEWGHSDGAHTMVHSLTGNARIMPPCARGTAATVFGIGLTSAEETLRTVCSHCLSGSAYAEERAPVWRPLLRPVENSVLSSAAAEGRPAHEELPRGSHSSRAQKKRKNGVDEERGCGSVAPAAPAFGWRGLSRQRLRLQHNRCALIAGPLRTTAVLSATPAVGTLRVSRAVRQVGLSVRPALVTLHLASCPAAAVRPSAGKRPRRPRRDHLFSKVVALLRAHLNKWIARASAPRPGLFVPVRCLWVTGEHTH